MKTKFFSEYIFNIDVTWEFSSDKALQKKIDSFHSFRTEVIFFPHLPWKLCWVIYGSIFHIYLPPFAATALSVLWNLPGYVRRAKFKWAPDSRNLLSLELITSNERQGPTGLFLWVLGGRLEWTMILSALLCLIESTLLLTDHGPRGCQTGWEGAEYRGYSLKSWLWKIWVRSPEGWRLATSMEAWERPHQGERR